MKIVGEQLTRMCCPRQLEDECGYVDNDSMHKIVKVDSIDT